MLRLGFRHLRVRRRRCLRRRDLWQLMETFHFAIAAISLAFREPIVAERLLFRDPDMLPG